ncbi:MAG: Rne/Rng family ribonuclease [Muribaculaceae bacterium]|nr:Rne/Rng family ribonuclease [Muribaculaceae bacterium]
MKSELIVDVQAAEVSIALLEDGRLVSLQKEARNIAYAVGDIYLAKVKKLMPGLNAAFVNVGYEKDAFLHYLDLGSHFSSYEKFVAQLLADRKHQPRLSQMKLLPEIDKHGSVTDLLAPGKELLVQIVKEPISSKGPRLTTDITLTGRYLVLTPFCDKISISQKIKSSEEKTRLHQLVESIKPRNYGVIIRTSAEGKRVAELNHELKTLVQAFEDACEKAQRSTAPELVFEEENRVVGMLRDVFSPSFENIHVNDPDIFRQIQKYVDLISPGARDIVKLYEDTAPIFDHFGITRQIKSSFGKTVSFKSGAYIIIEHTEALHVIDVNSGNRSKATNDQESNALEVNLRAADEIARQLRLRDMGGIIVVDFIDMAKAEHRQQLYDHMREIMANDRARHNILPLSKFGLMQITRQRVRPVLDITVAEECPSCFGKGKVQPSILFTDTLFEKLEYMVGTLGLRDFVMYVHPYVDAYIKKGLFSTMYGKWRRTLGRCFKIVPDQSLAYLQYRAVDKDGKDIPLREEKDSGKSSVTKSSTKARSRGENADNPEPKKDAAPKQQPKPKKEATAPKKEQAKPVEPKTETAPEEPKPTPAQKPKPRQKPATAAKPEPRPEPKPEVAPAPPATPEEGKADESTADTEAAATTALLPAPIIETPALEIPDDQESENNGEPAKKRRRRRRRRKPAAKQGQTSGSEAENEDADTDEDTEITEE